MTISIIGIMAGMVFGVLHSARQSAAEAATKATIAKLNTIIMKRYESYLTRRVPISLSTDTSRKASAGPDAPKIASMPFATSCGWRCRTVLQDINADPITLPNSPTSRLPSGPEPDSTTTAYVSCAECRQAA